MKRKFSNDNRSTDEKTFRKVKLREIEIGSILTALAISLGMVGILRLVGFSISPAIPSAFAAVGAAIYAARMR